jgi:hypothetical protein
MTRSQDWAQLQQHGPDPHAGLGPASAARTRPTLHLDSAQPSSRSSPLCFDAICSRLMESPPSLCVGMSTTTAGLPQLGPFGVIDTVAVASVTAGVAPDALATTLATIQAATTASRERDVGAAVAVGAAAACPHPPADLPFSAVSASATIIVGAIASFAADAALGAMATVVASTLVGTAAGAAAARLCTLAVPPLSAAGVSGPVGTATGAASPLAAPAIIDTLTCTAVGAPAWLSFYPSVGGALYWSSFLDLYLGRATY